MVSAAVFFKPPCVLRAESFYKGKMFKIVVGSPPGGFYDAWARLLSRYMPKYMPGNPDSIVQNMPGAGHWSQPITSTT